MPSCGFILVNKNFPGASSNFSPRSSVALVCSSPFSATHPERQGSKCPLSLSNGLGTFLRPFCAKGAQGGAGRTGMDEGQASIKTLQRQKSTRPQTNLPPQNKQGSTAQKSAPVHTEINRNLNTALKGNLINAWWEADQGEMKCGSQGFFSVKMHSTKCGAEAQDNKNSEDQIHQWIYDTTLHPTLLFSKCPYAEWQQSGGTSSGQKQETLSQT